MTTMSESRMRLHFLSLVLLCCVSPSSSFTFKYDYSSFVACGPHQSQALTEFMNEFDSSHCNLSDPFNGVFCDNSTGAVTKLQLSACLSGTLKPNSSLFRLHHLRFLVLIDNNFISSSLPSEFSLFNLNIDYSSYVACHSHQTKALTEFMNEFDSSYCNLNDPFNGVWCDNSTGAVTMLRLQSCLSGTLKPNSSLFRLRHLRHLNLTQNNFISSSLPSEFGNLSRLENFPKTSSLVQNLTMLSVIAVSDNHFSGTIPSSLFTMLFLSLLGLRRNDLSGSFIIPNSSATSMLDHLYLGHNHFEGNTIEPISKLVNLKLLDLSFLNTSYPIDVSPLFSLKSLVGLDLSANSISPASLVSNTDIPTNMESLLLQGCGITEFPKILKNLEKLEFIALSNNRIKGKIPEWLWNLPRLTSVFLPYNFINGFEGPVDVLVNSSVKNLEIGANCFEGAVPILPLSINFLEGSIPDEFYTSASLRELDVGHNRLTGKLPRSLLNCSSLEFLVVDHNRIKDMFPFWLKALPNLKVLILSSNKFYGSISPPGQGGPLGFREIRLCGLPLQETCFGTNAPPTPRPLEEEKEEEEELLIWKGVATGYGLGVLLGLAIAQVIASYKPEWLVKIIGPNKHINR
ncbi:hypothetical protein F2Q70_00028278 [Brassica cretica]|uniref:Leucine-rich repeat-containing N-terminal plant-type domain-containing protein n=1 Tax=Brassica cretica TaxID=69181 RepID=A0A8S9L8D6_BRACR|nr:hypothetical protein F2Q70_00028278 [Brassica cretica]